MKKVLFFLTVLYGSIVNSGQMESEKERFAVYVPNLPKTTEITGGVIFLRPSIGGTNYNVHTYPLNFEVPTPLFSPSWVVQDISTSFSPGFLVNLRQTFENTGLDFNLYWVHLRTDNTTHDTAIGSSFNGPLYEIGPEASVIKNASGQLKTSFDVINADFAKHIHLDPHLQTRLLFGVTGIGLKVQQSGTFSGIPNFTITQKTEAKLTGAGIRLGLDFDNTLDYKLIKGINFKNWSLIGAFTSSLILGESTPSLTFTGVSDILTLAGIPTNYQAIHQTSATLFIPGFDGKVGVKYRHKLQEQSSSHNIKDLQVEIGYMGIVYLDAIHNVVPANYADNSPGIGTGVIYLKSINKLVENFALSGPYVTASLKL